MYTCMYTCTSRPLLYNKTQPSICLLTSGLHWGDERRRDQRYDNKCNDEEAGKVPELTEDPSTPRDIHHMYRVLSTASTNCSGSVDSIGNSEILVIHVHFNKYYAKITHYVSQKNNEIIPGKVLRYMYIYM